MDYIMDRFPFEKLGASMNLLQVTQVSTAMLPRSAVLCIKCKELKNFVRSIVKVPRTSEKMEEIIFNEQDTIYLVQDRESCFRIKLCPNGCQGCIPSQKCEICTKQKFYHGK